MIDLRGVGKRYGDAVALYPLDLRPPAGRTTALIGPSGCGKSTLLRILIGLIRPDSGCVLIDGQELTPATVRPIRHRMGYVVQDGGLFPHLSAADNAALLPRYLKWPEPKVKARLDEVAALARFPAALLGRYPAELSGGQRQRVSLMRALMLDPAVLLLDEPFGALDPLVRAELQEDLRGLFRKLAKTVVLVSHDLPEAAFLGDELVLMRDGRVVQRGPLDDLVKRPADPFVTRFINAQRPAEWKEAVG